MSIYIYVLYTLKVFKHALETLVSGTLEVQDGKEQWQILRNELNLHAYMLIYIQKSMSVCIYISIYIHVYMYLFLLG